jgi:hypothetical protein
MACLWLHLLSEWCVDCVATDCLPFTACCLADFRVGAHRGFAAASRMQGNVPADAAAAPAVVPAIVPAAVPAAATAMMVASRPRCANATEEAMLEELQRAEAEQYLAHQVLEPHHSGGSFHVAHMSALLAVQAEPGLVPSAAGSCHASCYLMTPVAQGHSQGPLAIAACGGMLLGDRYVSMSTHGPMPYRRRRMTGSGPSKRRNASPTGVLARRRTTWPTRCWNLSSKKGWGQVSHCTHISPSGCAG